MSEALARTDGHEDIRLARILAASEALAEAKDIPEVKGLHDQVVSVQIYLKQQHAEQEVQNVAAELKLRTERRLGELLGRMDKHPPGPDRFVAQTVQPPRLRDIGISKFLSHRWQKSSTIPESDFEHYLAETKSSGRDLTSEDIYKLARRLEHKEKLREYDAVERTTCALTDLHRLVEQGMTFGTIYADPPWSYDNQATRGSTDKHYVTMSPEDIASTFKPYIHALAATHAHLHMWTTNAFLRQSFDMLDAWGFTYKGLFVWVKPQIGMGNYWRVAHEYLMLGVKGNGTFLDHSLKSWLESGRGEHSDKPDEVRHLIERASPPPYLELFGRRPAPGWVVYGNEIEQTLFYQSLEDRIVKHPVLAEASMDHDTMPLQGDW